MTKVFKISLITLFILCIVKGAALYADDHGNARSLGMGKSGFVSSFGIDAYGLNPANFDYRKPIDFTIMKKDKKLKPLKSKWEISLINGGGSYGSDTTLEFYRNYLSYLSINREIFTQLFTNLDSVLNFRQNVLPSTETDVNYDFEFKWLSVNYSHPTIGAVNFSVTDKVGLNTIVMNRDDALPLTFQLIPHSTGGYDLTNVSLSQAEAIAWWLRKYSIGFGKQFDFKNKKGIRSISFGASASLVHGFGNVITYFSSIKLNTYGILKDASGRTHIDSISGKQNFNTYSALTDFFTDYKDGAKEHFNFFPRPAGKGFSFDFGFAIQIGTQWRFAASVTDLGSVTWDYNTIKNIDTTNFNYSNFYLDTGDPTYNTFVNDLDGFDTRELGVKYKTDMPAKLRAGLMFQPNEKVILELDWVAGANNLPGNSNRAVTSLGGEFFPAPFLAIRSGVSLGGPEGNTVAFGLGLRTKFFTADIGTNSVSGLFLDKRLSIAFSSKFIF